MSRGTLPLLALAWALAAAPTSLAQASEGNETEDKDTAVADYVDLDLDLAPAPDRGLLRSEQTWEGERARDMRQSLDVYFGAADGKLTQGELDAIARATEADMRNKTLYWLRVDGAEATVEEVNITFENTTGPVERTDPLQMKHVIVLSVPEAADGERRVELTPLWNGTIRLSLPEGWRVKGADEEGGVGEAEPVRDFRQGETAVLVLTTAPPPPGSGGSSDPQETTGPGRVIPAPHALLAVGLACAAAAFRGGGRRR